MVVILCTPLSIPRSLFNKPSSSLTPRNATNKSTVAAAERQRRRSRSPLETRIALVLSLAAQSSSLSQRVLGDFATETAKYLVPRRFQARNLEEAFMSVPNLETVKFRVLKREDQYEIREDEPYFIAETTMPGKTGFDFSGSSQGFNVLAAYLFGENIASEQMEMTTPVFTRKVQPNGEKMSMTTPVITKRGIRINGKCLS